MSAGFGIIAAAAAVALAPWQAVTLIGWDTASLVWCGWIWATIGRLDAIATSEYATREDPGRATSDILLLGASVASLVGVAFAIVKAVGVHGGQQAFLISVGGVSIIVSWVVVHTVFALKYAAIWYTGPDGGVSFNEHEKPCYLDFAYLAFTIGMTYQVSDTSLTTKEVRHTALRHALLSYLFGTLIVAATINLVAGLAR